VIAQKSFNWQDFLHLNPILVMVTSIVGHSSNYALIGYFFEDHLIGNIGNDDRRHDKILFLAGKEMILHETKW
jgi:hypothetical protein